MKYYRLEPEVAGGWGKNTEFTRTPGMPTVVHKLHYHFDGWLGDELLTTTPCFIATKRLSHAIESAGLTGAAFDYVEVTVSEEFQELYPCVRLPEFRWMKVDGVPGHDDFGVASDLCLVVSERALKLLKQIGISNAESITPLEG